MDECSVSDRAKDCSVEFLEGISSELIEERPSKPLPCTNCSQQREKAGPSRRTQDGGLAISMRVPDWSLPSMPDNFSLSSHESLRRRKDRVFCPQCGKSRHYFCYDCLAILTDVSQVPKVELPVQVDIILHTKERRSMSTGIHAALLAPDHVRILHPDHLPAFDPDTTALLFPSKSSRPVESFQEGSIQRVVVVDSKWENTGSILSSPAVKALPHVHLKGFSSFFWRYRPAGTSPHGVSTVEAILYLCRELHARQHGGVGVDACHCYDDLLWYFAFFHRMIEERARG